MYNIMIQHLYTLGSDHYHKPSHHQPPYEVDTQYELYSLSCTLYPCVLSYFVSGRLHLFILFPYFAHLPPPSSLAVIRLFSVSISQFLFCFVFHFTQKWNHMIFVFLYLIYFTSHKALSCLPFNPLTLVSFTLFSFGAGLFCCAVITIPSC